MAQHAQREHAEPDERHRERDHAAEREQAKDDHDG